MRAIALALALALASAVGLAAAVTAAGAAPNAPLAAPSHAANIVEASGGCGWGLHRRHGYCVPNHRHRHRPYVNRRYHRNYGYYRPHPSYGYYGGGYERWNRPSPSDHIANQLNAQQLGRGY
jgi:hypothetical protein